MNNFYAFVDPTDFVDFISIAISPPIIKSTSRSFGAAQKLKVRFFLFLL